MQSVYGRLPAHPRQGLHQDLLCAGSFWAARYDGDDYAWCRVVILEELEPQVSQRGAAGMSSGRSPGLQARPGGWGTHGLVQCTATMRE